MSKITTVIPVYKKKDIFLTLFAHNYPYLKGTEIIIIDDGSGEHLREDLTKKYPGVIVLENNENRGFSFTVNKGVQHAQGEYILLLNSDVKLLDASYEKGIPLFETNAQLFALSFAQIEKNEKVVGKNEIYFQRGMVFHRASNKITYGKNGWAEGGSALFRKEIWDKLHGLDIIYTPFYWEDIDLSYRAKKSGYQVLFDPHIVVEHHHESTIKTYYQEKKIKQIAYRNQFLFIWKNITQPSYYLSHIILLPFNLVYYFLKGEREFVSGFFDALAKLSSLSNTRKNKYKLLDQDILAHENS